MEDIPAERNSLCRASLASGQCSHVESCVPRRHNFHGDVQDLLGIKSGERSFFKVPGIAYRYPTEFELVDKINTPTLLVM